MNKLPSLLVECNSCGKTFEVGQLEGNITHKKEYNVNGQSIFLTYYDCPECHKRHYVQIDDTRSLEILKVNQEKFIHNAVLRVRGKKLRKKKVEQYKESMKHLAKYRTELMSKYEGKTIYDEEAGTSVELRFSI